MSLLYTDRQTKRLWCRVEAPARPMISHICVCMYTIYTIFVCYTKYTNCRIHTTHVNTAFCDICQVHTLKFTQIFTQRAEANTKCERNFHIQAIYCHGYLVNM